MGADRVGTESAQARAASAWTARAVASRPRTCYPPPEGQGQAGRRQVAHHPAHDVHDLLASDGTPMSAQRFMELLFGKLPEFFKDEAELRAIWSVPDTRKKLLQGFAEKGFGGEQLAEMQKIIDAEKSDLFDVLAHVAYALPPLTREDRAARAKVDISANFNRKQEAFLGFVLLHYISVGVEELDQDKLTPLLRLKYHDSIADVVADLGRPDDIGRVFAGFQKYLYQPEAAA